MFIKKKYGESKVENCPFCGKRALTSNSQKIPVCLSHKNQELLDVKCLCGEWLDLKQGKYGPYFNCIKCGNISFKKGLEMNHVETKKNALKKEEVKPAEKIRFEPRETIITSDELDFL